MYATRYSSSAGIAGLITFSLFVLMTILVARPTGDIDPTFDIFEMPDFTSIPKPLEVIRKEPPILEDDVLPPPVELPPLNPERSAPDGIAIPVIRPQPLPPTGPAAFGTATSGEPICLACIPPTYPGGPLSRGIEGQVLVIFTVTALGTVRDAYVAEAIPERVFNRAALKALQRSKFQPRMVEGVAIAAPGQRRLYSFTIEE